MSGLGAGFVVELLFIELPLFVDRFSSASLYWCTGLSADSYNCIDHKNVTKEAI
jgi:hypothetical protein